MQSKLIGIVLAVSVAMTLAAVLVNCTDDDAGIPDYYLTVPSYSSFLRGETYEALSKDTRPAGLEPQKMLGEFGEMIAKSKKTYERELYKEMQNLANSADAECSIELVNYIFEILTLAKEHPDEPVLSNYVNYVKAYGPAKFSECLKKSERQFDKVYLSSGDKGLLDDFFTKYFGLEADPFHPIDKELYTKARGLCLSSENLRVEKTLEVAKEYKFRNYEKDSSPQEIMNLFVGYMCTIFEKPDLKHASQIVRLGEALGAKLPDVFPAEYLKLVEFNRICIAWNKGDKTRPGMEEAPEVEGEAPAANKKWFKLF